MGVVEGNEPVSDNSWENIKKGGDAAIATWINDELAGKSCTVVLIGSQTADRHWINYEIEESWDDRKGLLGIYIHGLKDQDGKQTSKGANPFEKFAVGVYLLSSVVKAYDPPFHASTDVYAHIKDNLAQWVEDAIGIRNRYS